MDNKGNTHTTTMMMTKISYDDPDGPAIYNPYEIGPRASKAFAVEQYTRAVEAVYGIDLDPDRAELLMTRYQGHLDTMEGLTLAGRPQRVALSIIIFAVVWSLLTAGNALISRWDPRVRVRQRRQNAQALACLAGAWLLSRMLFARREVSPGKAEV